MLIARVRQTIEARGLIARGDAVLVGCSGGPDSVALTHVLSRLAAPLGFSLAVASVDHGLRPEAPVEVEGVGAFASSLGLPFYPLRVALPAGASLQATARHLRYGALQQTAEDIGASRLAVAHTQDDQAETVLGRLLRGAGLRGLGGIQPLRDDGVVRPLLDATRAEVLAHVEHFALPVVHDPSNRDPRFQRVRIRHGLLDGLKSEDPAVVSHLADLADDLRAVHAFMDDQAEALLAHVGPGTNAEEASAASVFPLAVLREAHPALRRHALRRWLTDVTGQPVGRAHLDQVDRAAAREGARLEDDIWLKGGWCVRHARLSRGVASDTCLVLVPQGPSPR